MTKVRSFLRHRWTDRCLLVESLFWLAVARLAVLTVSFSRIAPLLGRSMVESSTEEEIGNRESLRRISWALARASQHAPWDCNCLTRALAGKAMLRTRGIHSTLYLGVGNDEAGGGFHAHAWLRSGDVILSGAQEKDSFKVVSTFAD